MNTTRDLDLARLAQVKGLITAEDLRAAIAEHETARAAGERISIGQILVKRKAMTSRQYLALESEVGSGATPVPRGPTAGPQQFPGFEVLGELGRGGMGIVYRTRRSSDGTTCALKVLTEAGMSDPERLRRFRREARTVLAISHPHVVSILDAGDFNGVPYLAMELVEGESLEDMLQRGPLKEREALRIMAQVADGVAAAHAARVVHRDLKPGNVLIDGKREVRIIDFGLARTLDATSQLTRTGSTLGTPYYMSPEQIKGVKGVGPQADVYSMGVMLYRCLTGKLPFQADSALALYYKIAKEDPLPLRTHFPSIQPSTEAVVLKALQKEPGDRYPSAKAFMADLQAILSGGSVHIQGPLLSKRIARAIRRPGVAIPVVAAAVLVLAAGGWWVQGLVARARTGAAIRAALAEGEMSGERLKGLERLLDGLGPKEAQAAIAREAVRQDGFRALVLADQARRIAGTDRVAPLAAAVDQDGRLYAIRVISSIEGDAAISTLVSLCSDADPEVASAAIKAVLARKGVGRARLLAGARSAMDAGKHADALRILSAMRVADPSDKEAAALAADAAVKANPTDTDAILRRAQTRLAQGDAGAALADFEAVTAARPRDTAPAIGKAWALLALGRPYEAASTLIGLQKTNPGDQTVRSAMEQARERFGAAVKASPTPECRLALGRILAALGDNDGAWDIVGAIETGAVHGQLVARLFMEIASIQLTKGEPIPVWAYAEKAAAAAESFEDFQEAIRLRKEAERLWDTTLAQVPQDDRLARRLSEVLAGKEVEPRHLFVLASRAMPPGEFDPIARRIRAANPDILATMEGYANGQMEDSPEAAALALDVAATLAHAPHQRHAFSGKAASFRGNMDKAQAECEAALQGRPDHRPYLKNLVHYYLCGGRVEEAIAAAARFKGIGLKAPDEYYICMLPFMGLGRYQDALDLAEKGLALGQDHDLRDARGRCLLRLGRYKEDMGAIEDPLMRGTARAAMGDTAGALADLARAGPAGQVLRARLLLAQGRADEAERAMLAMPEDLVPEDHTYRPLLLLTLGEAQVRLGQTVPGLVNLEEGLDRAGGLAKLARPRFQGKGSTLNINWGIELGWPPFDIESYQRPREEAWGRLLAEYQGDDKVLRLLEDEKDLIPFYLGRAGKAADNLVAARPGLFIDYVRTLSGTYGKTGADRAGRRLRAMFDALPDLKVLIDAVPRDAIVMLEVGRAMYMAGRSKEAMKLLDAAWALAPEAMAQVDHFFHIYNNVLGGLFSDDLAERARRYEWAVASNKSNQFHNRSEARFGLAECYRRMGRGDDALKTLTDVIADDPGYPTVYSHLAHHWEWAGDTMRAAFYYRRMLATTPTDKGAREALERIGQPAGPE